MSELCRYAESEQFHYHLLTIPQADGSKLFVYYRRYAKKNVIASFQDDTKSLYDVFDALKAEKKEQQPLNRNAKPAVKEAVPEHRTLQIINFDRPFVDEQVRKWFKVLGKLRHVYTGCYKNKRAGVAKKIFFGLIVFKNEYEMAKCFNNDVFQLKLEDYMKYQRKVQDVEGKEQYLRNILASYESNEINEEKLEFLQRMEMGGFKIVTDRTGEYDPKLLEPQMYDPTVDRYGNRKKLKTKNFENFYKFQVDRTALANDLGVKDERTMTDKELFKRKKQLLLRDFENDRETLKKLKTSSNS